MAAARIETQYDFTANTGSAEAAVKRYADQIKAANAVLAKAEKTAKETYQSQSLSAKAAGASQEQLTKIQQQYFQSLVAIRNAAKETGNQLVTSNKSAVVSEDAKAEAIRLATTAIERQTIAVKANAEAQSHSHSISNQSAASGAVQFLEGRNGIRTIENFLGNTLGLGGIFGAIFPVIGAVQAGKLLYELGEKVYEVGEKAHSAGAKLEEAMDAAHAKTAVNIADLTVQADRIQDNIDKLSGHPSNGLRTAIDEAKKASMEFNQSLIENRKEVLALFKEFSVGKFGGWLADTTPTGNTEKSIDAQIQRMQRESQKINSDIDSRIAKATSLTERDSLESERQKRQNSLIGSNIGEWQREKQQLQSDNLVTDVDAKTGKVTYTQTDRNSGRIGDLDTVIGKYQGGQDEYNARIRVADLTKQELALKGQKEASTLAGEASRKALEAQRKALEDQRKQWDDDHSAWEAAGTRSSNDELWFWTNLANSVGRGSENYAVASKHADDALKKVNDERKKQLDEAHKMTLEFNAAGQKALFGVITSWGKGQTDAITSQKALEDAQQNAKYTVAESGVQFDVATGKISKYDAAVQLQTLHTMRYTDALTDLQNKWAQVQGGPEGDAQRNGIQKQIVELNARRATEQMQDAGAVANNTVSGALKQANQVWLQNTQDLAPQVSAIYTDIFKGMNSQIADMLTGQKANWSSFFRSIAVQLSTLGLNQLEAPLANSVQKAASSGGGFFASLFGGGRAVGGPVDAGTTYLVGERGPELFNPGASGTITPNNQLKSMMGGHNWNVSVDARGSTNPAEVEAAAHRAVRAAAPQIIASALITQRDQQSRRPYSQR